jgi:hypothetical protein
MTKEEQFWEGGQFRVCEVEAPWDIQVEMPSLQFNAWPLTSGKTVY